MQITYDRGDKLLGLADDRSMIPAQCKPLHKVRGITRNRSLATLLREERSNIR